MKFEEMFRIYLQQTAVHFQNMADLFRIHL